MLADMDSRHSRGDWLELTANLVGCLGFHVKGVVLAETTAQEDDDYRPARPVALPLVAAMLLAVSRPDSPIPRSPE